MPKRKKKVVKKARPSKSKMKKKGRGPSNKSKASKVEKLIKLARVKK